MRLKLKLPSGAEIELEGPEEFIRQERECFTKNFSASAHWASAQRTTGSEAQKDLPGEDPLWHKAIQEGGKGIALRGKLPKEYGVSDASLVLLGGSGTILKNNQPTAFQLAKWLRTSGYPVQRIDRILQKTVQKGEILASGSRRGRRYELTLSGKNKALDLARTLSQLL
ncbi:MAG: hypothetical protein HY402_01685 [Elusimicrobia bacterium]|nr:hypothetical protein [Elusimicrobiota bacterium]